VHSCAAGFQEIRAWIFAAVNFPVCPCPCVDGGYRPSSMKVSAIYVLKRLWDDMSSSTRKRGSVVPLHERLYRGVTVVLGRYSVLARPSKCRPGDMF
jgi:hypothetical protein